MEARQPQAMAQTETSFTVNVSLIGEVWVNWSFSCRACKFNVSFLRLKTCSKRNIKLFNIQLTMYSCMYTEHIKICYVCVCVHVP